MKTEGSVYGLTVAGAGLIAYVDPAFRVGTDQVDVVLAQPGGQARMKVATGGILGDVNNDSQGTTQRWELRKQGRARY